MDPLQVLQLRVDSGCVRGALPSGLRLGSLPRLVGVRVRVRVRVRARVRARVRVRVRARARARVGVGCMRLHDLHQERRPEERAIVALGQWPPNQLEQVRGAAVRLLQLRVRVCDGRGLIGHLGCHGTRRPVRVARTYSTEAPGRTCKLDRRPTAAPLGWPCRSGLGAVAPAQKVRSSVADAWTELRAPMQLGGVEVEPPLPARKANGEAGTAEARLCAAPPHQARRRGQAARLRSVSPRQQRGGGARRAASRETAPTQWRAVLVSIAVELGRKILLVMRSHRVAGEVTSFFGTPGRRGPFLTPQLYPVLHRLQLVQ
eukprot:scaffold103889_cov69-Phaeocystis_antarctica.AAC.1